MTNNHTKTSFGFTLVELMVATAIIAIIAGSFLALFNTVLKLVQIKRIKVEAAALATEQMEIVRNMPYTAVGVQNGIPSGSIPQDQTFVRSGNSFTVHTDVRYVDDPYDGVIGGPALQPPQQDDLFSADYKLVKFKISWNTVWGSGSMFFLTDVVPKGIESNSSGGVLKIKVFDANGAAVAQADVDIVNPNTSPSIALNNVKTDNNGIALFPGAPPSVSAYQITVDKPGFSQSRTYGMNDPVGNVAPNPLHPSVFIGTTTEISFAIDLLSTVTVATARMDPALGMIPFGASFTIHGDKTVGSTAMSAPIYKYSNSLTTDLVGGTATLSALEWDTYTISFDQATLGYNIVAYNPSSHPVILSPNDSKTITFTFQPPYRQFTLLVTVLNENSIPLVGATVQLINGVGYNESTSTGVSGQSFFAPLTTGAYTATITNAGYVPIISPVTISGNNEYKAQLSPQT